MVDEPLGRREFDGFSHSVRDDFKRFGEQLTQVAAKIDTLVNGRIEEARVIGEISGAIRSINERLERLERQQNHNQSQIDELWDNDKKEDKSKVNWWSQIGIVIIAAIAGVAASKLFR